MELNSICYLEFGHFSRSPAAGCRRFLSEPCMGEINLPRASEGQEFGTTVSPSAALGQSFNSFHLLFPPNHQAFGDSGGEEGRGGNSLTNPESGVSLFVQSLSERSLSLHVDTLWPPHPGPHPQHGNGVGGEGGNSWGR